MDSLNPYPTGKSPPPSAPSVYNQPPATRIPVPQHNYNYVDNYAQPPPPPPPPPRPPSPPLRQPSHVVSRGKWSTGLCGCCSDISTCCITCWCPCITFGQIADIVDQGTISCCASGAVYALLGLVLGCSCLYSCFYRSKMRRQYMLPEKPCADCCVHFCCECCALCQEHRELKRRGFDMSIGWRGNMERQNPGITMAPNFQGGMNR